MREFYKLLLIRSLCLHKVRKVDIQMFEMPDIFIAIRRPRDRNNYGNTTVQVLLHNTSEMLPH